MNKRNSMTYGSANLLLLIVLLFGSNQVSAFSNANAPALGMAGAYTAVARNLDAVDWNPANLNLPSPYRFSLTFFLLPSLSAGGGNNVLSTDFVKDYEGRYLTQADKADILDLVSGGLQLDGSFRYDLVGFSVGRLGFKSSLAMTCNAQIPDAPFEWLLQGAGPGDILSFSDLNSKVWIINVNALSYAYPLDALPRIRSYLQRSSVPLSHLSVGATVKLLRGLTYVDMRTTQGEMHIGEYYTYGNGLIEFKEAGFLLDLNESEDDLDPRKDGDGLSFLGAAGHGLALDLGVSVVLRDDVTVGLSINNIPGVIKWSKETYRGTIRFETDSLNVVKVAADTTGGDSLYTLSTASYKVGSFTTDYPTYLSLGIAYTMKVTSKAHHWISEGVTFSTDFRTSSGRLDGNGKARFAFGVENRLLWGHLPVRCGFAFGGEVGKAVSIGMGLHFQGFQWDFGVLNRGSILGAPLGGDIGTRFRFTF